MRSAFHVRSASAIGCTARYGESRSHIEVRLIGGVGRLLRMQARIKDMGTPWDLDNIG